MRTDRRTDVMKLTVAFRNFAKAHKNKQGRKCTYNLTSWRVRITIIAAEKQSAYSECVVIRV
jgi:hypothetical protein